MFKAIAPPLAVAAAISLVLSAATAQTPSADPPPLRLSLGDLMTTLVQPRHAKLALGGQARNWEYARYEQRELEGAFKRIEGQVPRYHDVAMADLMNLVKEPMERLEAAIKVRDGARFDAAYGQLTDACNACHLTTEHKMIVIEVPKASAFPDQSFASQKP